MDLWKDDESNHNDNFECFGACIEIIGSSPSPISIFPLKRPESRALRESIVYRRKLNDVRSNAYYQTNIPESWYGSKFQSKVFMATK